ncbi:MAG: type IV secretory system conjugative DNA transfer family protein, partial [Bacteroidota bacterium]
MKLQIAAGFIGLYLSLLVLGALNVLEAGNPYHLPLLGLLFYLHAPCVWPVATLIYLLASWLVSWAKLEDMLAYLSTQRWRDNFMVLAGYWALVGLLLLSPYYSLWLPIFLALCCLLFPYVFTHQAIKNPTEAKTDTLWLLGKKGQQLPLNAPELGVFIVGSPGSGKTKFVIEPLIYRLIAQGYTGVLYDYDFSADAMGRNYSLSHLAYHCCKEFTAGKTRFVSINFEDLLKTRRINPLSPAYIKDRNRLSHILRTLLLNMAPGMKEDFWYKNTYALLKGLAIFFANKHPTLCTLPHIIVAGLQPVEELMSLLQQDAEARLYASPILDAYERAPEQLAGVLANFKVMLDKLLDPAMFWVLSGDDTPATVNDPERRTVVCLGNTPTKKESFAPVLAMLVSFLSTNMYGHGRARSFLMLDELPTLFLPQLSEVPATARKYGVSTIVALQNIAQLEKRYTAIGATELQETFSNHLIGRSPYKVAKDWSERIGRREVKTTSLTSSKNQESKTVHEKEKLLVTPQETMDLGVG